MMRRLVGSLPLAIGCLLLGNATANATPLTVAYVDTVTGFEWAQVTGSTGFAWWEVDAVCSNDGSTACAGNVGAVALNGWTWARASQIMDLMANATDLSSDQLSSFRVDPPYGTVYVPTSVTAADSTWAPQFLSIFAPTIVTDTYRSVAGWAADGAYHDPRSAWIPEVRDAAPGGNDSAGPGPLVDSAPPFAPLGSSERGVWLFRPVASVPEPSSLLLVGVGIVVLRRCRSRAGQRDR